MIPETLFLIGSGEFLPRRGDPCPRTTILEMKTFGDLESRGHVTDQESAPEHDEEKERKKEPFLAGLLLSVPACRVVLAVGGVQRHCVGKGEAATTL